MTDKWADWSKLPADAGPDDTLVIDNSVLRRGSIVVPRNVAYDARLSLAARHLWTMLAGYGGPGRRSWPGRERLAEQAGVHPATLDRHINELRRFRYLATKRRGQGRTNLYWLFDVPNDGYVTPENDPDSSKTPSPEPHILQVLDSAPVRTLDSALVRTPYKNVTVRERITTADAHDLREHDRGAITAAPPPSLWDAGKPGPPRRIPAEWVDADACPPAHRAEALRKGVHPTRVEATWDAFAGYWQATPNPRGLKTDWNATWRSWVATAIVRDRAGEPLTRPNARSGGRPTGVAL